MQTAHMYLSKVPVVPVDLRRILSFYGTTTSYDVVVQPKQCVFDAVQQNYKVMHARGKYGNKKVIVFHKN